MQYLPVRTTARPPRVAVAIPGPSIVEDDGYDWRLLVEGAVAHMGRFWGGAAGVVVPVHDDGLGQPMLRALAAYDPDFVVPYGPSAHEGGESLGTGWLPDAAIEQMSAHLSTPLPDDAVHSPTIATRHGDPQSPLTACATFADAFGMPTSLEIQGDRDVAVAVAARVGVMSERDHEDVVKGGRKVHAETKQAHQQMVLDLALGDTPGQGVWNDPGFMASLPLARSRHTLSWLVSGVRRPDPTILVVGDDADDFCLAMVADRVLGPGHGVWCPWAWLTGPEGNPTLQQDALVRVLSDRHGRRGDRDPLVITSVSGTVDRIEAVADRLRRVKDRAVVCR